MLVNDLTNQYAKYEDINKQGAEPVNSEDRKYVQQGLLRHKHGAI
jgi:hypothetical protein